MTTRSVDANLIHALAASAFLVAASAQTFPLGAQGLDDPQAIDKIIGTTVEEEETEAEAVPERVIAAIEKTPENISTVRMTTSLDKVDIVFLPDAAQLQGGPPAEIEKKLEERSDDIQRLRQELEGNAMLYHAIDSRQILIRDILAVEFDEDRRNVVIYAAAKPAGG
ncbi:MAG: hypothetical protein K5872_02850 [Rhizobiaceae bacterium]|nr:hypothetical protein [Rhizobiaceae bacterium]MCV0405148.1 hypothetical protein [Rhizobiaceae bacterium]